MFFSEEKNQKTFAFRSLPLLAGHGRIDGKRGRHKSLLLLFFRKEGLASSWPSRLALTSLLALCAAAPRMHRAPQAPLPSTLPPPAYVGDPGTRLQRAYGGTPTDVTTYHYDLGRTGWNPTETDLTPATVASAKFGLIATLKVDGNVLAQPLLVSNMKFPSGATRDVLIIATGHDSVFAFDAQTYAPIWHVSLGTSQSSSDVGCFDILPEYGITSTPVIVRGAGGGGTLYVVAATEPSPNTFVTKLHALDLANGKDLFTPAVVTASAKLNDGSTATFDPQNQYNRAGLAYANGSVYLGIGSHCDNAATTSTGWLLRYSPKLAQVAAFHTVQTHGGTELASVWMTGYAPAIDAKGNVYFSTGNGDFTQNAKDWGESVLKLNSLLSTVSSSFTTYDYAFYNSDDTDLGSGGVMLIPPVTGQSAPPLAVTLGKPSRLYLLNQNALGGLHANDSGALQNIYLGYGGLWGGPAYYDGANGPTVFAQVDSDVLHAWSLSTGSKPALTEIASGTSKAGYGGTIPIVSSHGATPGTGIVWLIDRAQEPFSIEAYNAETLGAPIFSAQIGKWSNLLNGNPFLTPMEANGRVYAPGYKIVQVYGLTP